MGRRILVVDDSFGDRMILKGMLMSIGYQVVGEAKDGRESLEKYNDLKPDLVIMDVSMPEMDGVAAAREIVSRDQGAAILMSATRGQRSMAVEALQVGAKDFVLKPFQPRRLLRVIQGLIG